MKLPLRIEADQPSHGCCLCLCNSDGTIIARTPEVPEFEHPEQAQDMRALEAIRDAFEVLRDVAALLPCAGRMHPSDLFALQTRVTGVLAKAGAA